MKWAHEAGHIESDPAAGVKASRKKTEGFRTWTEEEMAAYEARWPVGTRERVWFDILAYTGLRRSDVVRLGRGNLCNGLISIRTKKIQ
jgi:integrase